MSQNVAESASFDVVAPPPQTATSPGIGPAPHDRPALIRKQSLCIEAQSRIFGPGPVDCLLPRQAPKYEWISGPRGSWDEGLGIHPSKPEDNLIFVLCGRAVCLALMEPDHETEETCHRDFQCNLPMGQANGDGTHGPPTPHDPPSQTLEDVPSGCFCARPEGGTRAAPMLPRLPPSQQSHRRL